MTARGTWKQDEREVAKALGGRRIPVSRRYKTQRVYDQLPMDDIVRMFVDEKVSAERIAVMCGVGPTLIRRMLRRRGVLTNPSRARNIDEWYQVDDATGCWLWTGALDRKGYAIVWNASSVNDRKVHQLSCRFLDHVLTEGNPL